MNYFTGKHLHSLLIAKGHSLHGASKALGISPDELSSYLTYERFEKEQLSEIFETLNLGTLNTENIIHPEQKVAFLKSLIHDLVIVIKNLVDVSKKNNAYVNKTPGVQEKLAADLLYMEIGLELLIETVEKRLEEI